MREGVLLLDRSLTLSRFRVDIDRTVARPSAVLATADAAVIEVMLARGEPIVFIGFGAAAAEIFATAGLTEGRSGNVALILREHPAFADKVLGLPNPFILCNSHLEAMGIPAHRMVTDGDAGI